jgi:hypothetical protein
MIVCDQIGIIEKNEHCTTQNSTIQIFRIFVDFGRICYILVFPWVVSMIKPNFNENYDQIEKNHIFGFDFKEFSIFGHFIILS